MERPLRDKDCFVTSEGWIFSVLGDVHPRDRVWAVLKYVPGPGPWRSADGRTYTRLLVEYSVRELLRTIDFVRSVRPDYVHLDLSVGSEVIAPPLAEVTRVFRTKERALELLRSRESLPENSLERRAVELIGWLSEASGVPEEGFGVTGSILLGIAHQGSDVDLIVHGESNSERVLNALAESGDERLRLGVGPEWASHLRSQLRVPREHAELLASRVVHKGEFSGTKFSVFGVRERPPHAYGEVQYTSKGIVETVVEVVDDSESLFTPAVYRVEERVFGVERLVTYLARLAGVLRPGDRIVVRAKLEEVRSEGGTAYQLLLGSYEGVGVESLRFVG
ncbi:MAG: nucleotidyltransferase domain-containing protein [Candidatus Caldarchaeales archaeon]